MFFFKVNTSLLMNKKSIPSITIYKHRYSNYCDIFFPMARLFCCVFLLTFFFNKAISQDTLNVVTQNVQNFDLANDKRILFDGNSKTCNISIKDKNKLHQILLDSNFKLIGQYTEKRDWITATSNYESLEPIINSKKNVLFSSPFSLVNNLSTKNSLEFIDIFLRSDSKAYYFQKNSFSTNSSNFLQHWLADKKETIIYSFKEKNCFYWITFSTNENEYTLYKLNNNLLVESTSLKCLTQYKKHKNALEIVKADASLNALSNHTASAKIKLYFTDDLIYFTDNSSKEKSTIVHSIKKNNLAYLTTNVYLPNENTSEIINSNSFIYQNKLIQAVLTDKDFDISVHEIQIGKKIAQYTINRTSNESIGDSIKAHLFDRGGLYDDINNVSNSKSIWDEQNGEHLFVHAFLVNDSLQITAGISAVEKDLITPIVSNIISFFIFYNIFPDAGFLLGVSIKPADKLTSLYYKFNLKNDTLVNISNSKKFDTPFLKTEQKFINKNESSIVSIVLKNNSRVYICYSKKKNTFSFIRFVTK